MWWVPPAGRQPCDRSSPCCSSSGVTRAVALTALKATKHHESVPCAQGQDLTNVASRHKTWPELNGKVRYCVRTWSSAIDPKP